MSNNSENKAAVEGTAAVTEATISGTSQVIVFKLGTEEYGMLIDQIKEVVITPRITKVPLSASYVRGVANIRGNILAIIDLEERFGLKSTLLDDESKPNYSLVVESEDLKMGILVKEVPNTLAVPNKEIDYSPQLISELTGDKNYIQGLIRMPGRLIILIDILKIFSREEIQLSA